MELLKRCAKAVAAALLAAAASLQQAVDHDVVTGVEWLGVLVAAVLAFGVVWRIPNKPTP